MTLNMKIEEMITDARWIIRGSWKLTSHDHEIWEQLTESNAARKPTRQKPFFWVKKILVISSEALSK